MKSDTTPFFITDLLIAGSLLTRLPLPHLPPDAFDNAARAVWAYPIAGAVLGAIAAVSGAIAYAAGLPVFIAAGLVVTVLTICSGAIHEDGLADTADGFWGAHTAPDRLAIMKDSHIGTYGTLALILGTGLRWMGYAALLPFGALTVIAVAALSRGTMTVLMIAMPNARDYGLSHSVGRPGAPAVAAAVTIALGIGLVCLGLGVAVALLGAAAAAVGMGLLAMRKISGQTGDVLGATQQISEIAILFALVIYLN